MKPNVERGRRVTAWLGVACLGLLPVSSLSAQEPKLRATLKGHTGAVVAVAFSPDSKTLASASYDGTLKLWDMTTGKERATLGVGVDAARGTTELRGHRAGLDEREDLAKLLEHRRELCVQGIRVGDIARHGLRAHLPAVREAQVVEHVEMRVRRGQDDKRPVVGHREGRSTRTGCP